VAVAFRTRTSIHVTVASLSSDRSPSREEEKGRGVRDGGALHELQSISLRVLTHAVAVQQVATRIAATGAVVVTHRGEPALALWDGAGQLCLLSLLQLRPLLSVSLQEAHPLLPRSALHFTSVAADGRMLLAAPTSFGSSNGSPSSALFRASLFRDENALQLPALAARLVRSDLGAPTLAMTHRPSPMAATKGLVRGLLAATGLGRELAGSTPARNTCPLAALLAPQSSVTPRQAAGYARDGQAGDAQGAACPREELFAGRCAASRQFVQ